MVRKEEVVYRLYDSMFCLDGDVGAWGGESWSWTVLEGKGGLGMVGWESRWKVGGDE